MVSLPQMGQDFGIPFGRSLLSQFLSA